MQRTISENPYPSHDADVARVQAVERYRLLDTPPDRVFGRIAGLAARFFNAPMATVSIVDRDRIWFMAVHGLETVRQVARNDDLCASAIIGDIPHVVQDALKDPRTLGQSVRARAPDSFLCVCTDCDLRRASTGHGGCHGHRGAHRF
jgi:hypothetical protein